MDKGENHLNCLFKLPEAMLCQFNSQSNRREILKGLLKLEDNIQRNELFSFFSNFVELPINQNLHLYNDSPLIIHQPHKKNIKGCMVAYDIASQSRGCLRTLQK